MAFGVVPSGFNKKRLPDISSETEATLAEKFGDSFDQDPRTPEGQLKLTLDERIALIWDLSEAIWFARYPDTATKASLDAAVSLIGITRKPATFSTIESGRARGVFGTIVPAGTIISVDGNALSRFVTVAPSTINIASTDEVQDITFDAVPDGGDFTLNFDGQITAAILFSDNAAAVETALEALSNIGVGNVLVTGSFAAGFTISFAGTLADQQISLIVEDTNTLLLVATPVVITIVETVAGDKDKTPLINLIADNTGPFAANATTLTVIETPVVGMEEFINELDAEIGTFTETDTELKIRRLLELQVAGAATVDAIRADLLAITEVTAVVLFQNISSVIDLDGRPPHSVDIVVQGGDEDEIAERIFSTVAAGIETIGDITKAVTDSQEFSQSIKFSRPTDIPIFLELDLTTDPAFFPVDGIAQVEAALLAYGDALSIGQNIIVRGSDPLSCAFDEISGILDFALRVSRDSGPPTLDVNISISPREIADFDSSRITVILL